MNTNHFITPNPLQETAYAKINLALHIRRRREDGYHELETLFAFVDAGDVLTMAPAERFELVETGEFAGAMGPVADNLVTRAVRLAHGGALPAVRLHIDKRLPVAAGLGGGSADAGAVLRMMLRQDADAPGLWARAVELGADVPACIGSVPVVGRGIGADLVPLAAHDLALCPVLLVNPRLALPTGPVFQGWDGIDRGPMGDGTASAIAFAGRNDLEASAIAQCPAIADVLAALGATAPKLARMSGSGATCFALYESDDACRQAQAALAGAHPGWWSMAGHLR